MKKLVLFTGGMLFGFGLAWSRMTQPEVVLSFLHLEDFGLLLVMLGAALIAGLTFHITPLILKKAPLTGQNYGKRNYPFEKKLVVGAGLFGIGWGISGICPGASYASLGVGNYLAALAIAGMLIGSFLSSFFQSQS